MIIKNLTPHPIKIGRHTIHQTGEPIRIDQKDSLLYVVNNIPVKMLTYTPLEMEQLPELEPETVYIVSRLVADMYKDSRSDFLFPYQFTRTPDGRILGCKSLARFEPNKP